MLFMVKKPELHRTEEEPENRKRPEETVEAAEEVTAAAEEETVGETEISEAGSPAAGKKDGTKGKPQDWREVLRGLLGRNNKE